MAAKKKKANGKQESAGAELENIKRLMVLLFLKLGAGQSEIARTLGVTQPTVSKMASIRKGGRFPFADSRNSG